ncbi:SdpI family protein [Leucobacter sp.]
MNPVELMVPTIAIMVGLLVLWWGVACRNGRFPRNPILGYRTVAALRSTPVWNAAHRGYAPWIILSGVALIVAGILAVAGVLAGAGGVLLSALGVGIVVLLAAVIAGGFFAHRSLAAYLRENGNQDD